MKKTKKTKKSESQDESETKDSKTPSKFGILGKDLSSRFSSRGDNVWRPTKRGGRNGNGKP